MALQTLGEMTFLFGLGIVYVVAYLTVRNVLVICPLLTPLGGFLTPRPPGRSRCR
jgi:hypothetical protein